MEIPSPFPSKMGTCSRNVNGASTAVFEGCWDIRVSLNPRSKSAHLEGYRGCTGTVCSHLSQEAVIPVTESHAENFFRSM